MMPTLIKTYEAPFYDRKEILRYAQVKSLTAETEQLLESTLAEAESAFAYAVCYAQFPIRKADGMLDLGFMKTDSRDLMKNLNDCESIVLFAATVGMGIDRLIARYSRLSPARALFFEAIGSERIESLCDLFAEDIAKAESENGNMLCPRFSPGYGDFPIHVQKNIFEALNPEKRIGLTLGESLLMSPQKSVTALIGIKKKEIR